MTAATTQPTGQANQMPVSPKLQAKTSASTTRKSRSVKVATIKGPIAPAPPWSGAPDPAPGPDFAQVKGTGRIDTEISRVALTALNIDQYGLDEIDNKILLTIIDKFKGGPVGVTTIATAIGEDAGTVEEVYEPYLIMEGFIKRTPRGRMVTELAYKHFGRNMYSTGPREQELFF